jgi:hypothetical protein
MLAGRRYIVCRNHQGAQQKLAQQRNGHRVARASSDALLTGRIFDDCGNRMSPTHSRKGAARHRYYVSSALIQGRRQSAGSVARVPAAKVEAAIVDAVRRQIGPDAPSDDTEMITTCVRRIEVRRTEIAISLANEERDSEEETIDPAVLTVPWSKTPHRRHRDVIVPDARDRGDELDPGVGARWRRSSRCRPRSRRASVVRATPIPHGNRPSTAALTRLGARKASEIVI